MCTASSGAVEESKAARSLGIGGGGVHVISAHKHLWSYFSYIFCRVRWGYKSLHS